MVLCHSIRISCEDLVYLALNSASIGDLFQTPFFNNGMLDVGNWPFTSKYIVVLSSSNISISRNAAVSFLFFDFDEMVIS